MHSGLILLLWLFAVAGVQVLPPALLAGALLVAAGVALLLARTRTLRLLRRVRVLMLAIAILFAWFTPGEALFADWPRLGPTREGVRLALLHGARLAVVVCAVGLLLERLAVERLVAGLYALGRSLAIFGLPAERFALRLLLVLRYVDETPRGTPGRDWKHWLQDEGDEPDLQPVQLARERFGIADRLCALALMLAVLLWMCA